MKILGISEPIRKFVLEVTGIKVNSDDQAIKALKGYFENNNIDIYIDDLDILVDMVCEHSGRSVDTKGLGRNYVIRDRSAEAVDSYESRFLSSGKARLAHSDKNILPGKKKTHYKMFSEFMKKAGLELPFLSIEVNNRSIVVVKNNIPIIFFDRLSEKDGKIYGYVRFGKRVDSKRIVGNFPLHFKRRKIIIYVPVLGSYKIFPVFMQDFFDIVFKFMKWETN